MGKIRYCLPVLVMWLAVLASGCASVDRTGPIDRAGGAVGQGNGWWAARLHMNWPLDEAPAWHIDLILADRVIAPVLERYRDRIALWRFHRRASRDHAGHQFSFLFHASPEVAKRIFRDIRCDALLAELKASGVVLRDSYDETDRVARPHIEDTSDPRWPVSIRKSWPYFIMGVSQMWLELIRYAVEDASSRDSSAPQGVEDLNDLYGRVNRTVTELARAQGRHAFLHHLNAVFGYEPFADLERALSGP